MPSQEAVDMLNETASNTRTPPRKRQKLNHDGLSSSVAPVSKTKKGHESLRRSPRKSSSKLQTAASSRPRRSTITSNEITIHPPISPNSKKRQEHDLEEKAPKRMRNLALKDKVKKSTPFAFKGVLLENVKGPPGVTLHAFDSPAKEKKGRKISLRRALKEHPIRSAGERVTHETESVAQQAEDTVADYDVSASPTLSRNQEDELDGQEDDVADEVVDLAETGSRSKSDAQENKSQEANHGSSLQKSTHSKSQPGRRGGPQSSHQPEDGKKKPKRPLTEEEMQQRQEKKRKQKAAVQMTQDNNAKESEYATTDDFGKRKDKFGRGIEVQAEGVGGLETWKNMGAGALTIDAGEDRTLKMGSDRADSIWRLLEYLNRAFQRLNDAGNYMLEDEEVAQHTIGRLKKKCTLKYLRPEEERSRAGDPTIVALYQRIIPRLVHLLKGVLQARYVDGLSREALEELLSLVEMGLDLCRIAMDWTPRPSTLPSGIKRAVHNYINPNLRVIQLWLADRKHFEEQRAIQQKVRTKLALAQKNNRERKQKLWAERQQRLASHYAHSANSLSQRPSDSADVFDIDDLN